MIVPAFFDKSNYFPLYAAFTAASIRFKFSMGTQPVIFSVSASVGAGLQKGTQFLKISNINSVVGCGVLKKLRYRKARPAIDKAGGISYNGQSKRCYQHHPTNT